jgi:hypothetical protein
MLWNRHEIDIVDRVDRERGYLDLDPLHIQSVAETGWSIHHLGIVTNQSAPLPTYLRI